MDEDPLVVAIEELTRSLLQERQRVYTLTRLVDELRVYKAREVSQSGEVVRLRSALAAVSWADTLEEAQQQAADGLAGKEREDDNAG